MLFKFNTIWKSISILFFTWVIYAVWGFEFTVITLLALILAKKK